MNNINTINLSVYPTTTSEMEYKVNIIIGDLLETNNKIRFLEFSESTKFWDPIFLNLSILNQYHLNCSEDIPRDTIKEAASLAAKLLSQIKRSAPELTTENSPSLLLSTPLSMRNRSLPPPMPANPIRMNNQINKITNTSKERIRNLLKSKNPKKLIELGNSPEILPMKPMLENSPQILSMKPMLENSPQMLSMKPIKQAATSSEENVTRMKIEEKDVTILNQINIDDAPHVQPAYRFYGMHGNYSIEQMKNNK